MSSQDSFSLVIVAVFLGFLAVFVYVMWYYTTQQKRMSNSSWKGVVTDKNTGTTGSVIGGWGSVRTSWSLTVRMSDGKVKTVNVSQGYMNSLK